jgi:FtsH-binding integral membrane protein
MMQSQKVKKVAQRVSPRAGYRRQMIRMVYIPLALGTLALLGFGLWAWKAPLGDASVWADIALVTLAVPLFFVGLVQLALVVGLAIGLQKAIQALPAPLRQVDQTLWRVRRAVRRGSDLAAKPLIIPAAAGGALRQGVQILTSIFSARPAEDDAIAGHAEGHPG